jgi:hypothetical protein
MHEALSSNSGTAKKKKKKKKYLVPITEEIKEDYEFGG